MIEIFIDGDACPVKDETYVVSTRYGLPVAVVANSRMRVPEDLGSHLVRDTLVEQVGRHDMPKVVEVQVGDLCRPECPVPEALQIAGRNREVRRVVAHSPGSIPSISADQGGRSI